MSARRLEVRGVFGVRPTFFLMVPSKLKPLSDA